MKRLFGVFLACAAFAGPLSLAARADDLSGTLVLQAYSGPFQDAYTKTTIEPFMKEHPGVKVVYSPAQGSAQMLGLLRAQKASPQADVTIMDFSVSRVAN